MIGGAGDEGDGGRETPSRPCPPNQPSRAANTGRRVRVDVIDITRVAEGRLVEHWGVADRLSLAQQKQIGLVPDGPR